MLLLLLSLLYPVTDGIYHGFIDERGEIAIPLQYESVGSFSEGLVAVRDAGCYGYINAEGVVIIPTIYDFAEAFHNGMAKVYLDGTPLLIDPEERVVYRSQKHDFRTISGTDLLLHGTPDQMQYIGDFGGNIVLDSTYESISIYPDYGLAQVEYQISNGDSNRYAWPSYTRLYDLRSRQWLTGRTSYRAMGDFDGPFATAEPTEGETYGVLLDTTGAVAFNFPLWGKADWEQRTFALDRPFLASVYQADPRLDNEDGGLPYEENRRDVLMDWKGRIVLELPQDHTYSEFDTNGLSIVRSRTNGFYLLSTDGEWVDSLYYTDLERLRQAHPAARSHDLDYVAIRGTTLQLMQQGNVRHAIDLQDALGEEDWRYYDLYFRYWTGEVLLIDTERYVDSLDQYQAISGWWHPASGNFTLEPGVHVSAIGNLIAVERPGKQTLTYYRPDGEVVYDSSYQTPTNTNVDRMLINYCTTPPEATLNAQLPAGTPKDEYQLWLDTSAAEMDFGIGSSTLALYLINAGGDTLTLESSDNALYLSAEARLAGSDSWRAIEYQLGSWCGNSYYSVYLPPGHHWRFPVARYTGAEPAEIRWHLQRIKIGREPERQSDSSPELPEIDLYSAPEWFSINRAQLWRRAPYSPSGLMDAGYN